MPANIPKPPYEPEMTAFLAAYPAPSDITQDMIPAFRKGQDDANTVDTALAGGEPFTHEDRSVPGRHGPVTVAIFRPTAPQPAASGTSSASSALRPAILYIHGGGTLFGNRFTGVKDALRCARPSGALAISVEYRLSPENPFPAPLDDCWAALRWVSAHAAELGADPTRLLVAGQSAGGNLAASLALLARDHGGPALCGQLLDCPMLDDRVGTASSRQYVSEGTWSRASTEMAWGAYLGPNAGRAEGVSAYAAPARAADLAGLPPAFVAVASAEVFRDEAVDYARRIWEAGGQAALHVWQGGFHCFDMLMPDHPVSEQAAEEKVAWVKRVLASKPEAKL